MLLGSILCVRNKPNWLSDLPPYPSVGKNISDTKLFLQLVTYIQQAYSTVLLTEFITSILRAGGISPSRLGRRWNRVAGSLLSRMSLLQGELRVIHLACFFFSKQTSERAFYIVLVEDKVLGEMAIQLDTGQLFLCSCMSSCSPVFKEISAQRCWVAAFGVYESKECNVVLMMILKLLLLYNSLTNSITSNLYLWNHRIDPSVFFRC